MFGLGQKGTFETLQFWFKALFFVEPPFLRRIELCKKYESLLKTLRAEKVFFQINTEIAV